MPESIFIATLGAEPQVVTLALDTLLARGFPVHRVLVAHTDPTLEPIRTAVQTLRLAFGRDSIYGNSLLFNLHTLTGEHGALSDVQTAWQVQAAFHSFYTLLRQHKQAGHRVHFCIAGGRKTLTIAAIMAAQGTLTREDHVWHLLSEQALLNSRSLHAPAGKEAAIIQLPLLREPDDREHARRLMDKLSRAERTVLSLLLEGGQSNAAIAAHLHKSPRTIANQLTSIYQKTQVIFELPAPPDRSSLIALLGRYS